MHNPFFIGFDIETFSDNRDYSLQPYRLPQGDASISSFAAVDENGVTLSRGLWPTKADMARCLEQIASIRDAIAVGWNTKFDVAWLIAMGLEDVVRRIQWFDGLIMRRGLENTTERGGWGLKATVTKFLPEYAGYEEEVGGHFEIVNQTLLDYNTADSKHTASLARIIWDKIAPAPLRNVQVVCSTIPAFARAWLDGVNIDRSALDKWEVQAERQAQEAIKETGLTPDVIRSPKKLLEELKLAGYDVTGTDKTQLSKFAGLPQIAAIIKYKRATGSQSRYIINTRKCLAYQGGDTVHPDPSMWGTYTGRCTYSSKQTSYRPAKKNSRQLVACKVQTGISLHQWPKKREGKIARSVIVPPPGYLLAEFDFSNQESRIMASVSGDPTMLSVFNDGKDFHSIMGSKPAGRTYEEFVAWYKTGDKAAETFRQMGKVANLSLAYRTGTLTFQNMARTDYDVVLSFDEAATLCKLFKDTYPGVVQYWPMAIQAAKSKGYAETMCGRRVYLDQWDMRRGSGGYASEQTAINFPIQGTGADMKFLGIALTDAYMQKRGARYLLDLHDALFIVIPDDERAKDTAREIKHILNTLPYEAVFGWKPRVPMPVDAKIGTSWGELKEV